MLQNDLLTRLMQHDVNAFLEMTDKYSWPVYAYIRNKITDKDKVEAVFKETMNGFYKGLYESNSKEPMEALLLLYAEQACRNAAGEGVEATTERKTGKRSKRKEKEKKKGGFFYFLAVLLLLAAIAAAIWVIIGLLMSMDFIPNYDLGYEWFHTNVLPWF